LWILFKGAKNKVDGILINPAAYTHTSVAIRDAIAASDVIVVEVHLSIFIPGRVQDKSLISPVAKGTIMGFGAKSYSWFICHS